MNVHLFGKADSPCIANWTVKKTAENQREHFDDDSINAVDREFYMDDFLGSRSTIAKSIKL